MIQRALVIPAVGRLEVTIGARLVDARANDVFIELAEAKAGRFWNGRVTINDQRL